MKHFSILVVIGCILGLTSNFLQAQITLTAADIPQPGDTMHYASDTNFITFSATPGGAAQNWDYGFLGRTDSAIIRVVDAATAPHAATFPDADIAIDIFGFWAYLEATPTALVERGLAGELPLGTNNIAFAVALNPTSDALRFPETYQSSYRDTSRFQVQLAASQLDANLATVADSVRWVRYTYRKDSIDGYGSLKLPLDTLNEVIRKYRYEEYVDSFYFYRREPALSPIGPKDWRPGLSVLTFNVPAQTQDTAHTYQYYALGYPLAVLSYTLDNQDTVSGTGFGYLYNWQNRPGVLPSDTDTTINRAAQLAEAGFSLYPNPASQTLHLRPNTAQAGVAELRVLDLQGRVVYRRETPLTTGQAVEIALGDLPAGMYLLEVRQADRLLGYQRFVRQ